MQSAMPWYLQGLRLRREAVASEPQRLDLLHVRNLLHLGKHGWRHRAVDLDQRNGVAAGGLTAEMKGGNVDPGFREQRGEAADEARFVLIGHVEHRRAKLSVHAN